MNKMEHVSLRDSNGKHTSLRVASAILATNKQLRFLEILLRLRRGLRTKPWQKNSLTLSVQLPISMLRHSQPQVVLCVNNVFVNGPIRERMGPLFMLEIQTKECSQLFFRDFPLAARYSKITKSADSNP